MQRILKLKYSNPIQIWNQKEHYYCLEKTRKEELLLLHYAFFPDKKMSAKVFYLKKLLYKEKKGSTNTLLCLSNFIAHCKTTRTRFF